MLNRNRSIAALIGISGIMLALAYSVGHFQGAAGEGSLLINEAKASGAAKVAEGWTPTGVYPTQEVYYPGTEALAEDEIRVIACGSGMPMPGSK